MGVDRCRQTLSIVERTLDGVATDRDLQHARACAACTRALGRVPAFEREFGAAARSFVTEPLPAAVLASPAGTAPGLDWSGRPMRALGLLAVTAVIVVLALVGVRQFARVEGGPGGTPALVRSEAAMVAAMADLGFSCRVSILDRAASPPVEGPLCAPAVPRSGILLAAAVERDASGAIDRLSAKGKAETVAGPAGRARVETMLAEIAGIGFPSETDAEAAKAWVRSVTPAATEYVREETTIGGLDLRFEGAATAGYMLYVDVPQG